VALLIFFQTSFNFDNVNASDVILEDMPYHYHNRFFAAAILLMVISIFSYVASFYETNVMFSISTLMSSVAIIIMIVLAVINQITSTLIAEKLEDKCLFVLPQFPQDYLMERGCDSKYLTFADKVTDLTCPKQDVALIWEDNTNMLTQDQKTMYGCVNPDCCD